MTALHFIPLAFVAAVIIEDVWTHLRGGDAAVGRLLRRVRRGEE